MDWWAIAWALDALLLLAAVGLYLVGCHFPFPGGDEGMSGLFAMMGAVLTVCIWALVTGGIVLAWWWPG